jgi:tetratricopeptide (TPR) repeat protein
MALNSAGQDQPTPNPSQEGGLVQLAHCPQEDFCPPEEQTTEANIQRLVRAVRRKRGFGLFFVECTPVQGQACVQALQQGLPQLRMAQLTIEPETERLLWQVEALWQSQPFDLLVLQGLEREMLDYEETKRLLGWSRRDLGLHQYRDVPPVLSHLNLQRENFRDRFPARYVLLVPPFVVDYFIHRAPDFFDWRSGLFRLPRQQEDLHQEIQQFLAENYVGFKNRNLTNLERIQRIAQVKGFLEQEQLTTKRRAALLFELGDLYDVTNKQSDAIAAYTQCLQIYKELDDRYSQSYILNDLGLIYKTQRSWNQSIDFFQQSLQICQELQNRCGEASALNNLGTVYKIQGRWDQAINLFNQSLQICEALDDLHGESYTLNNLGTIYQAQGRWDEAIKLFKQSFAIKQKLKDRYGASNTLNNLGLIYQAQNRWGQAIYYYRQSLEIFRKLGEQQRQGQVLYNLGLVYQAQGQWEKATGYHEQTLEIKQKLGDGHGEGITLKNLGLLYLKQNNQAKAIEYWQQALGKLHSDSPELQTLQQWLQATLTKP